MLKNWKTISKISTKKVSLLIDDFDSHIQFDEFLTNLRHRWCASVFSTTQIAFACRFSANIQSGREFVRKVEIGTRKSASNTSPGTNIAKWHYERIDKLLYRVTKRNETRKEECFSWKAREKYWRKKNVKKITQRKNVIRVAIDESARAFTNDNFYSIHHRMACAPRAVRLVFIFGSASRSEWCWASSLVLYLPFGSNSLVQYIVFYFPMHYETTWRRHI